MKKILVSLFCIVLLILTGCGTTVADIQKYEREKDVAKLKTVVNDMLNVKDKASIKDYHIEALKALSRMSPNNNEAKEYIEKNMFQLRDIGKVEGVVAPFLFRYYVKDMENLSVRNIEDRATTARRYAYSVGLDIVNELDTVIKSCKKYTNTEQRYDEEINKRLKGFSSLEDLKEKLKSSDAATKFAAGRVLRNAGAEKMLASGYSHEQIMFVVETAILLNPNIQIQYMTYDKLFNETKQLEIQRDEVEACQEQKIQALGYEKNLITKQIKKISNMLSNNEFIQESSKKSSAYSSINSNDVVLPTAKITFVNDEYLGCIKHYFDRGRVVSGSYKNGKEGTIWGNEIDGLMETEQNFLLLMNNNKYFAFTSALEGWDIYRIKTENDGSIYLLTTATSLTKSGLELKIIKVINDKVEVLYSRNELYKTLQKKYKNYEELAYGKIVGVWAERNRLKLEYNSANGDKSIIYLEQLDNKNKLIATYFI